MAIHPITLDFSHPESLKELAEYIGTTEEFIKTVAFESNQSELYKQHRIPKKNNPKAFRTVWEIDFAELREVHKSFQRLFEDFVSKKIDYPTIYSHGYIRGKSTFTNAAVHVKKKLILHADIKDFFPTITTARLQNLFQTFNIKPNIAETLAKFLTINGTLALGLPSSPLLANLVCLNLDKKLADLASAHNSQYTRYADDITFSSDTDLPLKIEIQSILEEEGFILADEKFHHTKIGQSHFVTGLSVSDDKPRIPRKIKRQIRQELRFAKKFGLKDHLGRIKENSIQHAVNRIDGTIRYINAVEPELAQELQKVWKEILLKSDSQPVYLRDQNREPWSLSIFFDTAEIETKSGKILIAGCITTEDEERIKEETQQVIRHFSANPLISGYDENLDKKGLSFGSVPENVRTEYIDKLRYLTFRSFIVYNFLDDRISYEESYLSLLSSVLPQRLMTADQAEVTLVLNEDPRVTKEDAELLIKKLYSSLEERNHKRPLKLPEIIHGKKNEYPGLSVIDFVLNVFGSYAQIHQAKGIGASTLESSEENLKRYERLRDKIRFIESKITGEIFTQKKGFTPWIEGLPDNRSSNPKELDKAVKGSESRTTDMVREIIQNSPHTLIMKGGGVKGLAYVGAVRELEKYYNFTWFAGTSAGAIAASLLAIEYTTDKLEEELRRKDFKDFLDAGPIKALWNILSKGGLYESHTFRTWLDSLFNTKIKSVEALPLSKFPKRLTVYASRRNKKALIFDSEKNKDVSASFAVRCSMSIPGVFTPQRDQGLRIFDGGMQNNYPVDEVLTENSNMKFIGLYLGNYYEGTNKEPWLVQDLFHIFTEAVDVDALIRYEKDTVIIDPRPITTIDFWLTDEEKDFLVITGKVAALKFLKDRNLKDGPNPQDIEVAEKELDDLREQIKRTRNKRKTKLIVSEIILTITLLIIAGIILKIGGVILTIILSIIGGIILIIGVIILCLLYLLF